MSIDSRKVLTYAYLLKLVIFHHDIDVDTRIRLPEGLPLLLGLLSVSLMTRVLI